MIEPMKKVALLMSAATREPSLESLRRLGVVHLQHSELSPSPSPLVGEGRGGGCERLQLEEKLQLLRDALALAPPGSANGIAATEQSAAEGVAVAADWLALHRELLRRQGEWTALRRQRAKPRPRAARLPTRPAQCNSAAKRHAVGF